jgi:hypothetical protein
MNDYPKPKGQHGTKANLIKGFAMNTSEPSHAVNPDLDNTLWWRLFDLERLWLTTLILTKLGG